MPRTLPPRPRLVRALTATFSLALALTACDSGGGDPDVDPSPLVGRWELGAETRATYATLTRTQSVLDYLRPGTGDLAVSGAVNADLRFLSQRWEDATGPVVAVASAPVPVVTPGTALVRVAASGYGAVELEGRSFVLEGGERPDLITIGPDRLTVASARFFDPETGDRVVVSGGLTYARQTLEAGREALVMSPTLAPPQVATRVLEFAEGGGLRAGLVGGALSSGRWEVTGDGRLVLTVNGGTTSYTYGVDPSALTLTRAGATDSQSGPLLEGTLDLEAGTVGSTRVEVTERYARSAPG